MNTHTFTETQNDPRQLRFLMNAGEAALEAFRLLYGRDPLTPGERIEVSKLGWAVRDFAARDAIFKVDLNHYDMPVAEIVDTDYRWRVVVASAWITTPNRDGTTFYWES